MTKVLIAMMLMSVVSAETEARADGVGEMKLFDFGQPRSVGEWGAINDGVMGGLSTGGLRPTQQGTAVFTGVVSLENNGGFASVRSIPGEYDLSGYQGLSVRVRGDGRTYKLNLKTDRSFDGVLYRVPFETLDGEWQTIELPFSDFLPTFRGRVLREATPLDLSRVASVGLMISDKQDGPFRLEVAWIKTVTSR